MKFDLLRKGRGMDFGVVPMLHDLRCSLRRSKGYDRLKLLQWIFTLHLRPPSSPLHSLDQISFSIIPKDSPIKIELRCNQSDLYTFAEIFLRDVYQDGISHVPEKVTSFVDLGAHIGLTSLLFSLSFPNVRVVCVEPVLENVSVLRRNMILNNLSWNIIQKAVGTVNGTREFYGSQWWSSGTIVPEVGKARISDPQRPECFLALPPFNVEVITIDSLLKSIHIDFVDVLKIDIEGAEALIINENANWLSQVGLILLDIHQKYIDPKPLLKTLSNFGFVMVKPSHGHCHVFKRVRGHFN